MSIDSITIDPPLARWPALLAAPSEGALLGRSLREWRELTRSELDLPIDRPIIATGHQPIIWHPGILAKYIAVEAAARPADAATLHLVVDQDVVDAASIEIPQRRTDGRLMKMKIEFAPMSAGNDVPACSEPAFKPRGIQIDQHQSLPAVAAGVERIAKALAANSSVANAAVQIGEALSHLMQECADLALMPLRMSSSLLGTTLGQALLQAMRDDPHRCAEAYNRASAEVPDARLTPLAIRDDYVELPLWRLREDSLGRASRIRAYDSDIEAALAIGGAHSKIQEPESRIELLPRALLMTALIRLAVADIFVHGLGGAVYDRAMERWIREWLGVGVAPMAVVSATMRLPLMSDEDSRLVHSGGLQRARSRNRLLAHDPESIDEGGGAAHRPGPIKQAKLREIDRLPSRSPERRAAFFHLHQELARMREQRAATMQQAELDEARVSRLSREALIARRRDWAFPLYPNAMLRELVERVRSPGA